MSNFTNGVAVPIPIFPAHSLTNGEVFGAIGVTREASMASKA